MAGSLHAQALPVTHSGLVTMRLEDLCCVCLLLHCRCHVMERESFTSLPVAKLLNDGFVSVKVDKEERSDVDRVYMTYVQVRCSALTCACPRTHPKRSVGSHLSKHVGRACLCRKELPLKQGHTCCWRLHATCISTAC